LQAGQGGQSKERGDPSWRFGDVLGLDHLSCFPFLDVHCFIPQENGHELVQGVRGKEFCEPRGAVHTGLGFTLCGTLQFTLEKSDLIMIEGHRVASRVQVWMEAQVRVEVQV
jgi:hypothetical protein